MCFYLRSVQEFFFFRAAPAIYFKLWIKTGVAINYKNGNNLMKNTQQWCIKFQFFLSMYNMILEKLHKEAKNVHY